MREKLELEKVYLHSDFREVSVPRGVLRVDVEEVSKDNVRFVVLCTAEEKQMLSEKGFLEGQLPEPIPEEEKVPQPGDPDFEMPLSYPCPSCKKTHKQGTSAFVEHLDEYFETLKK